MYISATFWKKFHTILVFAKKQLFLQNDDECNIERNDEIGFFIHSEF